jgi:hypothetical protein
LRVLASSQMRSWSIKGINVAYAQFHFPNALNARINLHHRASFLFPFLSISNWTFSLNVVWA